MIAISPININNYSYKNRVSFGTLEREVEDSKFRRLDNLSNIKWRNNTYLFRMDLPWGMVTRHIAKDDKPKKIYCYACSDGSEPYSVAMSLISKLGYEKAQKYFPIIARDRDAFVINKAKNGIISLNFEDFHQLKKRWNKKDADFFEFKPLDKDKGIYKVNDKLRSCVDFNLGDILKEKDSLDYDGNVIFFRNVWPYLKKSEQLALIKTFKEKFSKDSSLIIGDFDINNNACDSYFKLFPAEIVGQGLWQVKPKIFQINNIDTKNESLKDNLKILRHALTVEAYCQFINKFYHNCYNFTCR